MVINHLEYVYIQNIHFPWYYFPRIAIEVWNDVFWNRTKLVLHCYWDMEGCLLKQNETCVALLLRYGRMFIETERNLCCIAIEIWKDVYWNRTKLVLHCYWDMEGCLLKQNETCVALLLRYGRMFIETARNLCCIAIEIWKDVYWNRTKLVLHCYWDMEGCLLKQNETCVALLLRYGRMFIETERNLCCIAIEIWKDVYWNSTKLVLHCYWDMEGFLLKQNETCVALLLRYGRMFIETARNLCCIAIEIWKDVYWNRTKLVLHCYWDMEGCLLKQHETCVALLLRYGRMFIETERNLCCIAIEIWKDVYWNSTKLVLHCYWDMEGCLLKQNETCVVHTSIKICSFIYLFLCKSIFQLWESMKYKLTRLMFTFSRRFVVNFIRWNSIFRCIIIVKKLYLKKLILSISSEFLFLYLCYIL